MQKKRFQDRELKFQDARIAQMYRTGDNLICFCTSDQLSGMKPATWWQRNNDVDLMLGIYKHGFGNYTAIKEDKRFSLTQECIEQ